jgi:nuclear pore complex protein Nup88
VVCLRSRSSTRRDDGGLHPDDPDDPDDPRCARVSLLEEAFAAHHSCRVLRAQWHPNGDGHLVLLLSDGTLRVFDAATNVATPESAYRLDPWGRQTQCEKPSPYPLRPEIVDFAFAPPHGWGALALILLGREGDVYTLCPFAPAGTRFPRVTLEALARGSRSDARADAWLAAAFPSLFSRASRARADGMARGLYDESDESGDDPYDARGGDSDDDGRNPDRGGGGGVRDDDEAYAPGGATLAARRCRGVFFESGSHVAPALRGPLPLGTDPVEGDSDAGGGALGRGAVARCLAAAPFAAGEGGGALLAVAHQRGDSGGVSATLDVLILPQEPSPGWARVETRPRAREATRGGGGPLFVTGDAYGYLDDDDDDADAIALTPPVDDEDEGALPPLLAIDRVRLVATRDDGGGGVAGEGAPGRSRAAAAANELAPFVSAAFDPGCRERVFCCAGGAVHAVTLTWLAQVEGAVDDEDDGDDDAFARGAFDAAVGGGSGSSGVVGDGGGRLPLPAVVTLLDSSRALLGVAPVGDPLAEGLVLAVDVAGNAEALHPAPPLPPEGDADAAESAEAAETLRRSLAAAAEASAELRALAEGPADGADGVPAASGSRLTPGTPEGNSELARAAMALKERHLRFAHRVHAACRRHGTRLGVEVARQKAEARVLREGLASVLQRRETLARRLERAKGAHADARERLRRLAEMERSFPRPATAAESAFRVTLRAAEEDAPLLRAKLDELRRRAEAVRADPGTKDPGTKDGSAGNAGAENAGARALSGARFAKPDPADAAVREELRAQEAAIRRNAARAEALASR